MNTRFGCNKDMEKAIRQARRRGWRASTTGSGHVRLVGPAGDAVVVALTPSPAGLRADLKRLRKVGAIA